VGIYNAFIVPSADYSSIAHAVARSAAKRPEIQAAYVFGSVATGRVRADSDVDVAVLIDRRIRRSRTLSYRLKLMADLGSALHRSDVEVVILNDAPPLLAHRVLSRGVLAFERSRSARVRFQVKTAAQYLDLIPMFETHIRYLKKNVRRGRIVG
jgi:predicted nucleotidyltransferase